MVPRFCPAKIEPITVLNHYPIVIYLEGYLIWDHLNLELHVY